MSDTKISEAVGIVGAMPGTDGFTMACFKADEVPVGTPLYLHPQPPAPAEQQGDTRSQFEAWNNSLPSLYRYNLNRWSNEAQEYRSRHTRAAFTAWQAALAASQPEAQGTGQDHLLDRRNRLMNSYGNGDREDAAIDVQIAQVDAELALIDQRDAAPGAE